MLEHCWDCLCDIEVSSEMCEALEASCVIMIHFVNEMVQWKSFYLLSCPYSDKSQRLDWRWSWCARYTQIYLNPGLISTKILVSLNVPVRHSHKSVLLGTGTYKRADLASLTLAERNEPREFELDFTGRRKHATETRGLFCVFGNSSGLEILISWVSDLNWLTDNVSSVINYLYLVTTGCLFYKQRLRLAFRVLALNRANCVQREWLEYAQWLREVLRRKTLQVSLERNVKKEKIPAWISIKKKMIGR